MPKLSVMVLANEEVISALLGAMVELDGYSPLFPAADEQPLTAICRHRPDLLLLDCEHELAWDSHAMRTILPTTRILLFSALRSQREVEPIAARYGIPAFVLPVAFREFTAQVEGALESAYPDALRIGA